MNIRKEIKDDNEFYLWFNGQLIFKKWLNQGYSKVFDRQAWGKYTEKSITDFDLEDTPPLYHVQCRLNLLSTNDGGRKTPVASGYRPNHVFEYEADGTLHYTYIGDLQFGEDMQPGESRIVTARFLTHQPIEQYLTLGRKWWIHEGPIKIGEAEILKVELPKVE